MSSRRESLLMRIQSVAGGWLLFLWAVCHVVSPVHGQSPSSADLSVQGVTITVEDLGHAVPFHRDALAFAPVDTTALSGPSVGRLVGVFGARVKITALRPPGGGIGIELLDYQAPGTGRPMPVDTKANDLWHWHVRAPSIDAATPRLLDAGHSFVLKTQLKD